MTTYTALYQRPAPTKRLTCVLCGARKQAANMIIASCKFHAPGDPRHTHSAGFPHCPNHKIETI
jgi:hypothetical protein